MPDQPHAKEKVIARDAFRSTTCAGPAGLVPTFSPRLAGMARVIVLSGPGAPRMIDPSKTGVVIGRHANADVTLPSGSVSRRHARLTWEHDQVFVEDLGSSNGTFVNDARIPGRTRLRAGDLLRIGASVLRLETPAAREPEREMTIQSLTAAATSNQELFKDHAATKLQAVLQLAHQLGHSPEVDPLLRRLLDQLLVLLPKADQALVLLGEADDPVIRASAIRGGVSATPPSFSRSVLRKVFSQTVGVLAESSGYDQTALSNLTLNALGIRSLVCVPLQAHGGRVFGALQLDRLQAGQPFSSDDLYLLTAVALMVAPVLENAQLHEDLRVAERLQRELALAREIQLGFLPREAVQLVGGPFELFAELHPALEISGDFYDYFPLDERRVAFAVADVSGKGMPAALFMTMVRALARHLAKIATGPADLLASLNDAIARDNPNFQFVTMVAGVYDAVTGCVTLAHGGHPPVVLRRRDGSTEELTHRGAPLLGMEPGLRRSEEAVLPLGPGDAIFLYTDGVTESPGLHNVHEQFGPRRLADTIRGLSPGASLAEWTAAIRGAVAAFSGADSLADDITLLALRRPESNAGIPPAAGGPPG
jgi:serine phosphatase RsbU (regulator of sigma subunit)